MIATKRRNDAARAGQRVRLQCFFIAQKQAPSDFSEAKACAERSEGKNQTAPCWPFDRCKPVRWQGPRRSLNFLLLFFSRKKVEEERKYLFLSTFCLDAKSTKKIKAAFYPFSSCVVEFLSKVKLLQKRWSPRTGLRTSPRVSELPLLLNAILPSTKTG